VGWGGVGWGWGGGAILHRGRVVNLDSQWPNDVLLQIVGAHRRDRAPEVVTNGPKSGHQQTIRHCSYESFQSMYFN